MSYRNPLAFLASFLVSIAAVVVATAYSAEEKKKSPYPWPSEKEVALARHDVDEIFLDRIHAARTPEAKQELAREMLKVAEESVADPAGTFVLFSYAQDLAVKAKDWPLALEAITGFARRFEADSTITPVEQIRRGDRLRDAAQKKPTAQRLEMQLDAAEWYVRAKLSKTGKGLTQRIAEKRLDELAEAMGMSRATQKDDLKHLLGAWEVVATNGFHGTWLFLPDGVVKNESDGKGQWIIGKDAIKIVWGDNAWETFHRPLNPSGVTGDSWHGQGILSARKVGTNPGR